MEHSDPIRPRRTWPAALSIIVPAAAFLALLVFALMRTAGPPGPGDEAPSFEAPLLSGDGDLALSDLEGRPVLLNFWASWCGPCEDEAPMLKRAHDEFQDEVAFVGIDIKDSRTDATEFVNRYGLDFPHVRDERLEIYDDYGLTGQPETFFIDADGEIFEHVNGPMTEDVLFGLLAQLIADNG